MDANEPYGEERAARLVQLLRALAERINALEGDADLLRAGPELLRLMGDARSELFHYEVRCTYESPWIEESRRIVDEAVRQEENLEFPDGNTVDSEGEGEDGSWRE